MDTDADILAKVTNIGNFLELALYKNSLDDWSLAKDLGELLIRIDAEEMMGHALLTRACRHMGDYERAHKELSICRALVTRRGATESERELFLPVLAEEEKQLDRVGK